MVLLPDTPLLALKAALQSCYLEGDPDPLNRVLGFTFPKDEQPEQEGQEVHTDSSTDYRHHMESLQDSTNEESLVQNIENTFKEETVKLSENKSNFTQHEIMAKTTNTENCNIFDEEFDEYLTEHKKGETKDLDAFKVNNDDGQIRCKSKIVQGTSLNKQNKKRPNRILPEKLRSMIIRENPDKDVDFTISLHGGTLFLFNGFLFNRSGGPFLRKDGLTVNWMCTNRKCNVNLVTIDGIIQDIKRSHEHGIQMKEFEWNRHKYEEKFSQSKSNNTKENHQYLTSFASSVEKYEQSEEPAREKIEETKLIESIDLQSWPEMDPRVVKRPNLVIQDELKEMLKTDNPDHEIDFTITQHGGTLMYLDGFIFNKEHGPLQTKFGISIRWRCVFQKCKIKLSTFDGVFKEFKTGHTHKTQEKDFQWNRQKYELKVKNSGDTNVNHYLDQTYPSEFTEDIKPKYDTSEEMHHAKSKKSKLFIDETLGTRFNKTRSRNPFVLLSDEMKESHIKRNPNHRIQFTKSQHGGTLLLLDDFLYRKNKGPLQRKAGLCIYWVCFNANCKVRLISEDGTFAMIQSGHDHQSNFNCFERYQEKEIISIEQL